MVRRLLLAGALDATAAAQAVDDLRLWPGERCSEQSLLPRMWELRGSVRPYDAAYIALAEALDVPLLTCDHRLAKAHGVGCELVVFPI